MFSRFIKPTMIAMAVFLACMVSASTQTKVSAQQGATWQPPIERLQNGDFGLPGTTAEDVAGFRNYPDTPTRTYKRVWSDVEKKFVLEIQTPQGQSTAGVYQRLDFQYSAQLPLTFRATVKAGVVNDVPAFEPTAFHPGVTVYVELHYRSGRAPRYLVRRPFYSTQQTGWTELAVTIPGEYFDDVVDHAFFVIGIIRGQGKMWVKDASVSEWTRNGSGVAYCLDDLYPSQWPTFLELDNLGIRPMLFPRIDWLDQSDGWTTNQLLYAVSRKAGVGAHLVTHPDSVALLNGTELPQDKTESIASARRVAQKYGLELPDFNNPVSRYDWELKSSEKILEDLTCQPIYHFASPYGSYSGTSEKHNETYFDTQRHSETGSNPRGMHPKHILIQPLDRHLFDGGNDPYHAMKNVDMVLDWCKMDSVLTVWVIHDIKDDPSDLYSCPQWLVDYAIHGAASRGIPGYSYDKALRIFGDREQMFPEDQYSDGRNVNTRRTPITRQNYPPRRIGN